MVDVAVVGLVCIVAIVAIVFGRTFVLRRENDNETIEVSVETKEK